MGTPGPDPFADHDRALVAAASLFGNPSASYQVSVNFLATGRSVPLGTGEHVAGDPKAPGAFVSVAAPVRASLTVTQLTPDARIELRDAGRRPVLLVTAMSLNRVLGQNPRQPVLLKAFPDPSGGKVAVVVDPVLGGTGGVVLLSRAGRLLGFAALALRPEHAVPAIAWAPSGLSMAFAKAGSGGAELGIWAIGSKPVSVAFPDVSGSYGRCMWSPDGSSILCADGFSRPAAWAIASATGERMVQVSAPAGVPVAWLP